MADLSPAAQLVKDAVLATYADNVPKDGRLWALERPSTVAALRAAAEGVKPDLSRTPWLTNDDGYFNETFENMEALGELNAHYRLLDIATELEVHS